MNSIFSPSSTYLNKPKRKFNMNKELEMYVYTAEEIADELLLKRIYSVHGLGCLDCPTPEEDSI